MVLPNRFLFTLVAILGLAGIPSVTVGAPPSSDAPASQSYPVSEYVGGEVCAACHADEAEQWAGSHHDLAMQEATEATVLGDFEGTDFTAYGVTSRFFKNDGKFHVNTEGPDGHLRDFEIAYTFGVYPLQQYLVAFPGGRYQALGIAWDSRPETEGGQRWFHLYPNEHIASDDALHWTGINQNWNFMCAECHSTNLRRAYDFETDRYQTTWSEIDVSCEACHGPGSEHVAWAKRNESDRGQDGSKGLDVSLNQRAGASWVFENGSATASRFPATSEAGTGTELDVCATCHARRAPIADGFDPGQPLLDNYHLSLLTEQLYHADGQIKDEVYVYGSFLQSKMYAAGVTCSDCHDPHSLALKSEGNDVCVQCHLPDRFDTPAHHFHDPESAGASCVACHAPETTYMVVDPRRDHSFRIPRPDLSVKLGVPNACADCHENRTNEWAAARVDEWYGTDRIQSPHFGQALAAGRTGAPGAVEKLASLAEDPARPAIARATAIQMLGQTGDRSGLAPIVAGLKSDDALTRLAAVQSLGALPVQDRVSVAFPLLQDPVRSVRLEAARVLAPVPLDALPAPQRGILSRAFDAYIRSLKSIADRPESLMTLANFRRDRGEAAEAENLLQTATQRFPSFAAAYVNLADLYRQSGRDKDGERVLLQGLDMATDHADLAHSLGLLYVRQRRYPEAEEQLARAAALAPGNPRYGYVYAIALNSSGKTAKALHVLKKTLDRHPNDRDSLLAMASMSLEQGNQAEAAQYAERLIKLSPNDPRARQILRAAKP